MGSRYFFTILVAWTLNCFLLGAPTWQAAQSEHPLMVVIFAMAEGAAASTMRMALMIASAPRTPAAHSSAR